MLSTRNSRRHYETVVTHDAEDISHPQALRWINYNIAGGFHFVQIPVSPEDPACSPWTHGIYCDDSPKCIPATSSSARPPERSYPLPESAPAYSPLRPSSLAEKDSNPDFHPPSALTEDYKTACASYQLGFRQTFIPILKSTDGSFRRHPRILPPALLAVGPAAYAVGHRPSGSNRGTQMVGTGCWKTRYCCGATAGPNRESARTVDHGDVPRRVRLAGTLGPGIRANARDVPVTAALGLYRVLFRMRCVMQVVWKRCGVVPVRIFLEQLDQRAGDRFELRK